MSAASAPKPEEAPEPASDADGWALLEGLRRRLDDQAALSRKTQTQVAELAESIAGIVEQQRRRSLWLNVNSFVAYLMFTMLCGAGCYLLYLSRAKELTTARERAVSERDAAVRTADDATLRAVAREAADNKAWEVYQLLEAGKRLEAVAKLDALRDQPLSKTERAVLAARVHDTQVMEVDAALKAAVAAYKAGRPGEVIKPLEAALTGEPPGARAAMIHYYLGVAYARTELDKAAAHLQAAIAGDVDQDDARFQLASVLDRSGAFAQARAEYDRFATAHPQSPLAVFAMRRSATLARLPAALPLGAGPAAGPGVAPGAVVPPSPGATPPPGRSVVPSPGVPQPPGAIPPTAPGLAVPPPAQGLAAPAPAPAKPITPAPTPAKPIAPATAPAKPIAPPAGLAKPIALPTAPAKPTAPPPAPAKPTAPPPLGVRPNVPTMRPVPGAVAPPSASAHPPAANPWIKPAAKPLVPPNPPAPKPGPPASEPVKPPAPAKPPAPNPALPPGEPATTPPADP